MDFFSLLVYRNTTVFLCPDVICNFTEFVINSNLLIFQAFPYRIMSFASRDSFFLHFKFGYFVFFWLIDLARICSTMLNNSGVSRHLVPDLGEKAFIFLHHWTYYLNALKCSFSYWGSSLLLLNFCMFLSWVCVGFSKVPFLSQFRWSCIFSPLSCCDFYTGWFSYIQLFSHSWNKSSIVCNLFNKLLDLVY